jgi:hypothetical protein
LKFLAVKVAKRIEHVKLYEWANSKKKCQISAQAKDIFCRANEIRRPYICVWPDVRMIKGNEELNIPKDPLNNTWAYPPNHSGETLLHILYQPRWSSRLAQCGAIHQKQRNIIFRLQINLTYSFISVVSSRKEKKLGKAIPVTVRGGS